MPKFRDLSDYLKPSTVLEAAQLDTIDLVSKESSTETDQDSDADELLSAVLKDLVASHEGPSNDSLVLAERDGFEAALSDGVDLSDPSLRDWLSDKAGEGAIDCHSTAAQSMPSQNTSTNSTITTGLSFTGPAIF